MTDKIRDNKIAEITSDCVRIDNCDDLSGYGKGIANLPKEQKEELIQFIETKLKELESEDKDK
jgi:hypothetical protein